jgi:hypothetical protein
LISHPTGHMQAQRSRYYTNISISCVLDCAVTSKLLNVPAFPYRLD